MENKSIFIYRCKECKVQEQIPINSDMSIDIYLDAKLTSSGCCPGCGTQSWGVYEDGKYFVC